MEGIIPWIINPGFDEYPIIWLILEIFCHIIYYYSLAQISSYSAQILYIEVSALDGMLPVKPMGYVPLGI